MGSPFLFDTWDNLPCDFLVLDCSVVLAANVTSFPCTPGFLLSRTFLLIFVLNSTSHEPRTNLSLVALEIILRLSTASHHAALSAPDGNGAAMRASVSLHKSSVPSIAKYPPGWAPAKCVEAPGIHVMIPAMAEYLGLRSHNLFSTGRHRGFQFDGASNCPASQTCSSFCLIVAPDGPKNQPVGSLVA